MKPLLKWPGGKRRIAEEIAQRIRPLMDDNSRYVECFAGGAAVFFHLEPKRAVLVDVCKPLVSFYEALRREPKSFCDELDRLIEMPFTEENFNRLKQEWNGHDFGVKFAARLLYLNRTCFNGLFRLNEQLGFNVAWGKMAKLPTFPSREDLKAASDLLRRATLYSRDYRYVLRSTHKGDVVFADPPYWGTYDRYAGQSFTEKDQRGLAQRLQSAVKRGVAVFASNIDCPPIRGMYGDWSHIDIIKVRHKIGQTAESRKDVNEVLVSALPPMQNRKQLALFNTVASG
jgi:DNA adenine methylase